jgi:hypothetical protein
MAKKKKEESPEAADSVLVSAAKGIGTAAGKVAAAVGVTADKPATPPKPKVPKLAPKNKSRLPRRQKKAQAKKAK